MCARSSMLSELSRALGRLPAPVCRLVSRCWRGGPGWRGTDTTQRNKSILVFSISLHINKIPPLQCQAGQGPHVRFGAPVCPALPATAPPRAHLTSHTRRPSSTPCRPTTAPAAQSSLPPGNPARAPAMHTRTGTQSHEGTRRAARLRWRARRVTKPRSARRSAGEARRRERGPARFGRVPRRRRLNTVAQLRAKITHTRGRGRHARCRIVVAA